MLEYDFLQNIYSKFKNYFSFTPISPHSSTMKFCISSKICTHRSYCIAKYILKIVGVFFLNKTLGLL